MTLTLASRLSVAAMTMLVLAPVWQAVLTVPAFPIA